MTGVETGVFRRRRVQRRGVFLAFGALLSSVTITNALPEAIAHAAPQTVVDDAGADESSSPGQKDLNFLTVDYAPTTPGTLPVTWGWDDTAWSGSNTGDACSLFDTDGDGKANNAM